MKRLVAEIPAELKELVDMDIRDNKQVIIDALRSEYGGSSMAALERRIEEQERRIEEIRGEKREREREIREHEEKLERYQEQLEEAKQKNKATIPAISEKLSGAPLKPDNPAVLNQAEANDLDPETLIKRIKKYREKGGE